MIKTKMIDQVQDTYIILCTHCGHKFISAMKSSTPSFLTGWSKSIQDTLELLEAASGPWTRMDIIRRYVSKNLDRPMLIHLFREMALDRDILEAEFQIENDREVIFKTYMGDNFYKKYGYDHGEQEKAIV
jgi:DNA-directed RNA polymerase subunit RPC12/RpoP